MAAAAPPPGWHADPQDPRRWRWWDGARWTEHVSAGPSALWSADYLVIRASARVARWSATIHDRAMARIGSVAQSGLRLHLLDAAGAPLLALDGGSGVSVRVQGGLRTWTVTDPAGAHVGELSVVKYFNRRITLALRAGGAGAGSLQPIGKVDRDFSVTDASGAQVARVWRAERDRSLLTEDETWAAEISRPLAPPLDRLALAAVCTLDAIQHVVQSSRSTSRFD